MHIDHLWLTDFRNLQPLELQFPARGLVAVFGQNGQGKTNLLEAISYVATLRSFRGASTEAMVRLDTPTAVVRCEGERDERRLLIECELQVSGRNRTLVNRQPLRRTSDFNDTFLATAFSPDDLQLVKAGPSGRRDYLDKILADTDLRAQQLQRDLDRILKQRNTLLRQSGGRQTLEITTTLDVWDEKLATAGEAYGLLRDQLIQQLQPFVETAYSALAGEHDRKYVGMSMVAEWRAEDGGKGLAESLVAARKHDLIRGVTTVGPHRDELHLTISGLPARTHASQGEQRTLALALRLASHGYLQAKTGVFPLLLLDDVFSELDIGRATALLRELPEGQTFLTTATHLPEGMTADMTVVVSSGQVSTE